MGGVEVLKAGVIGHISEVDGPCRAVTLFGNYDLGLAFKVLVFAVLVLFAVDEADDIGVLLDRTGFTKVRQQGLLVAGALFRTARELR